MKLKADKGKQEIAVAMTTDEWHARHPPSNMPWNWSTEAILAEIIVFFKNGFFISFSQINKKNKLEFAEQVAKKPQKLLLQWEIPFVYRHFICPPGICGFSYSGQTD